MATAEVSARWQVVQASPRQQRRKRYLGRFRDVLAQPADLFPSATRGGVMVRIVNGATVSYLFSVQTRQSVAGFICDFGGRRKGRKHMTEHPLFTAQRECSEESLGVLDPWMTRAKLADAPILFSEDTMYIVITLTDVNPALLCAAYNAARHPTVPCKRLKRDERETSSLVSVPATVIRTALARKSWPRYEGHPWSTWLTKALQDLIVYL